MPTLNQAQQLREFAEEVFEMSKGVWAAQSKSKSADQPDITETEFLTLDLLIRSQPRSVGDLQRHIGVLPAQMSRIIRSLENKPETPLVRCTINSDDKRKIDVELTEAGLAQHRAYQEMKLGTIKNMLLQLSEEDRSQFMRILRLMRGFSRKA